LIYLARGELGPNGEVRARLLAGVFEAVVGAIYLDRGMRAAKRFLHALLAADADEAIGGSESTNYKGRLQELIQERERVTPGYRTVRMTGPAHDRQFVVEAVRAGARGYVLKARDAEHLIQTVRLVAGGNMVIDPQLVVALAEELSTAKERDRRAETLTAREIEVLQLLAFGHTNRDIAERLYISPDTVKTHLEHIFEKLGASDRTAAVAEALRRRLIE
jgi:DNA-binding NarL/FixJ family response regulator